MGGPALDGLRAVAVIAVMGYHLPYGHVPGGFWGVELFFVLSGYLITSLLAAEIVETSRVSLRNFYMRRVLRLAPALVLTIVLADLVIIGLHDRLITPTIPMLWANLAVIGYVANWVQVPSTGDLGALSHAWSLAVEEQFYLLWPATLLIIVNTRRTWFWAISGALVAAAPTFTLMVLTNAPEGLYYLSTTMPSPCSSAVGRFSGREFGSLPLSPQRSPLA